MRTLENHVILYDGECPMCAVYTKAFVQTHMLDKNGRLPYQNIPEFFCSKIDHHRAVHEIALVNTMNGTVVYGVESIFKIIGNSFPFFKPLLSFAPFIWLMSKCYAFISYNRKVIIPSNNLSGLQPDLHIKYRLLYLLLTWIGTAYILTCYAHLLTHFVPIRATYREYLICGTQIFFQGIIIALYKPEKALEYIGNMMTISFAGALVLAPMVILNQFIAVYPFIILLYFLFTAGLMLMEHLRRCKILELGFLPSITWIAYRLFVLLIILL